MTDKSNQIRNVFYDDGTYQVSSFLLSTPRRFYPIENTTARIRRDPLWLAIAILAFSALTTLVYGDLLYAGELAAIWGFAALAWGFGMGMAFLHVDSFGHDNALLFGSTKTIKAIYGALREARTHSCGHEIVAAPDDIRMDDEIPF